MLKHVYSTSPHGRQTHEGTTDIFGSDFLRHLSFHRTCLVAQTQRALLPTTSSSHTLAASSDATFGSVAGRAGERDKLKSVHSASKALLHSPYSCAVCKAWRILEVQVVAGLVIEKPGTPGL